MNEITIMLQDGKVMDVTGLPQNYGFAVIEFKKVQEKKEAKPDLIKKYGGN